ncbi:MAG: Mur ligase family protein [bacterium]
MGWTRGWPCGGAATSWATPSCSCPARASCRPACGASACPCSARSSWRRRCPCAHRGHLGTDGKSTTTEMIGAVVRAAGRPAEVCGNIGVPFSARVDEAPEDAVLVVEVSAFQLWSCGHFRPQVA